MGLLMTPVRSFISSFKNDTRKICAIKQITSVVFAGILFIVIGGLLRYMVIDDTKSYTRIMLHQLYESPYNIDILFVGSSHCYRSLNPEIVEKYIDGRVFNAGSSAQKMDASFAMIKEANRYHSLRQVYLEMYYGVVENEPYEDRTQLTSTYAISDYLRPSFNKFDFLLHASSSDYYANSFILARRNWETLLEPKEIKEILTKKQSKTYKNYQWEYIEGGENYYDRGFVVNDGLLQGEGTELWNSSAFQPIERMDAVTGDSDWRKSLEKTIRYCADNNIELILFIAPIPEWTLAGKENYQEYSDLIRELAASENLEFYDFNLCKPEFFDTSDNSLFKDFSHLNTKGANIFSSLFGAFLSKEIISDELFFNSFSEKLLSEDIKIYGMAVSDEEGDTINGFVIANRESGILYKIKAFPDNGDERLLQEYAESRTVTLPREEHGILEVSWKTQEGIHDTMLFEY